MGLSEYQRTTGSVHSLGFHVVWCPKYRKGVLVGPVAVRLREHVFVRVPPSVSPSYIANQFKGNSSRFLRAEFAHLRRLMGTLWSKSYFVASVGRVSESTILKYIDEQSSLTKPKKR